MLDSIYNLINGLEFSTISVVIDKKALTNPKFGDWDILETAYMFLAERFNKFLAHTKNKRLVRIDKTSNKSNALNVKDYFILEKINCIRHHGTKFQNVENIEEPLFHDSSKRRGLWIADAIVYCATRHLNGKIDFEKYWNLLYPKM